MAVTTMPDAGVNLHGGDKKSSPQKSAVAKNNSDKVSTQDELSLTPDAVHQPLSSGSVDLKGRFHILSGARMPQFDSIGAEAFECQDLGDASRKCVAFICKPNMPIRMKLVKALHGVNAPGIMSVLEYGAVDWPLSNDKRMAVVMPTPRGEKFIRNGAKDHAKLTVEQIIQQVAMPIVSMMRELKNKGIAYRGISVENLFWDDGLKQKLILAESFTTPPAMRQASMFEPLSSAVCDPSARGKGSIADDVFSLGVLMLCLAIGKTPGRDMDQDELIYARIDQGTFNLYAGQNPIPSSIIDAVRGMIVDCQAERWDLEDVEAWIRGSRKAIKPQKIPKNATRPMRFADRDLILVTSAVYAISRNWSQAVEIIRNKSLDSWLRRSMMDEKLADEVQKTLNPSGGAPKNLPDEILVARTVTAMDADGPIRYKNFCGMIDGVGPSFAIALADGDQEKINLILQMIASRLPVIWIKLQGKEDFKNYNLWLAKYETVPNFIDQKHPGFGVERLLYELNPDMPCLSSNLSHEHISEAAGIIFALDKLAGRSARPSLPIDRHTAAFVGARMAEVKDSDLRALGASVDKSAQIMGMMNLLAKMQRISKAKQMPSLTNWCVASIQPVLSSYRNLKRRKRISEAVDKAASSGMIADLMQYANNEDERAMDDAGFKRAAFEHAVISLRMQSLFDMQMRQNEIAREKGESIAVVLSSIVMVLFLMFYFYMYFTRM